MDKKKGERTHQRRDSTVPSFSTTVIDENSSNVGGKSVRNGANRAASHYLDVTFVNARRAKSNSRINAVTTTTSGDDRNRYQRNGNNGKPQKKNYHCNQPEKHSDQSAVVKSDGLFSSNEVTTSVKQRKKRFLRNRFRAGISNTGSKEEAKKAKNSKSSSAGSRLAGIINVLCSSSRQDNRHKKQVFSISLRPATEMNVLRPSTPVTPEVRTPPFTFSPSPAAVQSNTKDASPYSRSSAKSKSKRQNAAGGEPRSPMMMWNLRYAALVEERESVEVKEKNTEVIDSEMQDDDSDSSSDLFELESLGTTITSSSGDCGMCKRTARISP